MKEIINNVEGILQHYNLSFKELNGFPNMGLIFENSDPQRLQYFIRKRFHKTIPITEARELEILLLTYNYISQN